MDETSQMETTLARGLRRVDIHELRRPIDLPRSLTETIEQAHREVDTMMDRLTDSAPDARSLRQHVLDVERLRRRVEAVQLRLTAQASRTRVHEGAGHLDPASWLARLTDRDRHDAAGQTALADALGGNPIPADDPTGGDRTGGDGEANGGAGADGGGEVDASHDVPGDELAPDSDDHLLAATGAALDSGTISAAHAQVIMRALADLPETITADRRRECEAELLRLCTHRSPGQLRRAARRVLEVIESDESVVDQHEDDLVAAEEERARERAAFWLKDNRDGTMTGHFTVPWVAGMMLKKVLDAMTAPRRQSPTRSDEAVTHRDGSLDWQRRRGLALADLLTRMPRDHLHTKVSATMLITTRLSDLQAAGNHSHTGTGTGTAPGGTRVASTDVLDVVSAGTARRLACGSGLLPAVLDGDSIPLDLGRQRRLFSDHQRLALAGRYDECAAEGCDRPFAWTETHHLRPWEAGGGTDLDNAVPLCGTHHHMIDSRGWTVDLRRHAQRRVSLSFHRRT